jgi:large subunit ribosomal protein L22
MTGTKTNERPGVRAQHRYARLSAYKAREVLDLIRGKSIAEARAILQFTERGAAHEVGKVLDSAVANAGANNDIPPEELFVSACFADEGPTLRRFRPRARGRASRIRKRTTHITVIVGRYSATELQALRERTGRRAAPADAAQSRARRVARSRQRSGGTDDATTEVDESTDVDEVTDETVTDEVTDETVTDEVTDTDIDTDDVADEADEADADEVTNEADSPEADADASDDDKDA